MKARINDFTMAYDDFGTGPAIVLLHGLPLNRSMWRSQVQPLVDAGFRVILPDLRGFGESAGRTNPWRIPQLANDVIGLLKFLGIGRAVIGGIDLGGSILLHIVEKFPDRVVAAVFVGTSARAADLREKRFDDELLNKLKEGRRKSVLGSFNVLLSSVERRSDISDSIEKWTSEVDNHTLEEGIRAMRDRKDYTLGIRSFQLPSLVIGAESDHFVKSEHSRFMGAALANGTCLVVPGAGHLVNLEKPGEFNRCLLDFLSRLVAPMQKPGLLSAVA